MIIKSPSDETHKRSSLNAREDESQTVLSSIINIVDVVGKRRDGSSHTNFRTYRNGDARNVRSTVTPPTVT